MSFLRAILLDSRPPTASIRPLRNREDRITENKIAAETETEIEIENTRTEQKGFTPGGAGGYMPEFIMRGHGTSEEGRPWKGEGRRLDLFCQVVVRQIAARLGTRTSRGNKTIEANFSFHLSHGYSNCPAFRVYWNSYPIATTHQGI